MNNYTKLKFTALIACIMSNLAATHDGPHYSLKNTTKNQIRIEAINTNNPSDLYFSDIMQPNETIGFKGGTGYPNLGLIAKNPDGQETLAQTGELPYQNAHINLNQDEAGALSFEIPKK